MEGQPDTKVRPGELQSESDSYKIKKADPDSKKISKRQQQNSYLKQIQEEVKKAERLEAKKDKSLDSLSDKESISNGSSKFDPSGNSYNSD